MDSDKRSSPEQWRLEDILKDLDVDDEPEAEEILHSILTSTGILTWNGKGEIVYRGHNIRGTDIVDLLKYSVTPTSFPRLQCEDEGRDEEALVWAGQFCILIG